MNALRVVTSPFVWLLGLASQARQWPGRQLPLTDALVDRWDRAQSLNAGEGSSKYGSAGVRPTQPEAPVMTARSLIALTLSGTAAR